MGIRRLVPGLFLAILLWAQTTGTGPGVTFYHWQESWYNASGTVHGVSVAAWYVPSGTIALAVDLTYLDAWGEIRTESQVVPARNPVARFITYEPVKIQRVVIRCLVSSGEETKLEPAER